MQGLWRTAGLTEALCDGCTARFIHYYCAELTRAEAMRCAMRSYLLVSGSVVRDRAADAWRAARSPSIGPAEKQALDQRP